MVIAALDRRRGSGGFTLLELMITVAIVAVLAAIALPPYFDFVTRSKLIDGTKALADFDFKMRRYRDDQRTYLNGAGCGIPNPIPAPADYFVITCGPALPTATTFQATATGIAARGTGGFIFRIDNTEAKSSLGPAGWLGNGTCWAVRKDGSCS